MKQNSRYYGANLQIIGLWLIVFKPKTDNAVQSFQSSVLLYPLGLNSS